MTKQKNAVPVRFRADPSRVRVSLRKIGNMWRCYVQKRGAPNSTFISDDEDPHVAVMEALRDAEGTIKGIDLDMQWAYDHPWKGLAR